MKEVKIQIPDNCELIKDGDTYIVKEKKQEPPRSWEEFCKQRGVENSECFITPNSSIVSKTSWACDLNRHPIQGRNWCVSREEAEAFLALMQLRQLRKAWVGTWEYDVSARTSCYAIVYTKNSGVCASEVSFNHPMCFPTMDMAEDFFSCFRDLCKAAKILL